MYQWPAIDQIQQATSGGSTPSTERLTEESLRLHRLSLPPLTAGHLIQQRRSAQAFDLKDKLPYEEFIRFLTLLASSRSSDDCESSLTGLIHPILWIHRVEKMTAGLYLLGQQMQIDADLKSALHPDFEWTPVHDDRLTVGLWKLRTLDNPRLAKSIHCHQAIASDAMMLIGCLSDFEAAIQKSRWNYRVLHWKAGMFGHRVYLSTEALGYRTTGIGCYFDDDYHSLLGLSNPRYQALYHLAIGKPILDQRIEDHPPYSQRIKKN